MDLIFMILAFVCGFGFGDYGMVVGYEVPRAESGRWDFRHDQNCCAPPGLAAGAAVTELFQQHVTCPRTCARCRTKRAGISTPLCMVCKVCGNAPGNAFLLNVLAGLKWEIFLVSLPPRVGSPAMRKRSRALLAVLIAAILGGVAWEVLRESEPVFKGKPLSYWVNSLGNGEGYMVKENWRGLGSKRSPS